MTKQITLEELLELVTVNQNSDGEWHITDVKGDVLGNVEGTVFGTVCSNVDGNVYGGVWGNVEGDVKGYVSGTINASEWEYVETPKEKLKRLIEETGNEELIEAFDELENN